MTEQPPFQRTKCACSACVDCCYRQPGPLAPGDFERIAAYLNLYPEDAKKFFCASPGALVSENRKVRRIGTITPKRFKGKCVFLDHEDRCTIHPVSPFGCAYFDVHQPKEIADERSLYLALAQDSDPVYKALRDELPYKGT